VTNFNHLLALSDHVGTFEHAQYRTPRFEHGYSVDAANLVVVALCNEAPPRSVALRQLERVSVQFLLDAQDHLGRSRNQRHRNGQWIGPPDVDDTWGQSLWALSAAATNASDPRLRRAALVGYDRGCTQGASSPRALAFATLGAGRVTRLSVRSPRWLLPARRFSAQLDARLGPSSTTRSLDNDPADAVLCSAAIVAGTNFDRLDFISSGLDGLDAITSRFTSLTDSKMMLQQPTEVAYLALAYRQAFEATYDKIWLTAIERCAAWFNGDNAASRPMWDPSTGAGFDCIDGSAVNENCGSRSTAAAIITSQLHQAIDDMTDTTR